MSAVTIKLPRLNKWAGSYQIQSFLGVLAPYWLDGYSVCLDFGQCSFLSAEGAALLGAFKLRRDERWLETTIDWPSVSGDVAKQLGRWDIFPLFKRERHPWRDTAIPLFHQPNLDSAKLSEYICTQVCVAGNMPAMSSALTEEIQRALVELFQNAFIHAESPTGCLAIGQLYPNIKEVQICVCDSGIGMVRKIQDAGIRHADSPATLDWALGLGNTTRRPDSGPPGGLGLYLLREFVKINGGSLRLVANDGYWCQEGDEVVRQTLQVGLPGTLIQLKLRIRDDVVYMFASEVG
jgi:anti-sigma regulatory factor (Ser/Thr protein kinase)